MLINAFYENGKLIWPDNLKLKDEKIPIVVEVPDGKINLQEGQKKQKVNIEEELDTSTLHPKVKKMLNKIKTILGPDYIYHATSKTDKELFIEGLKRSGKYGL